MPNEAEIHHGARVARSVVNGAAFGVSGRDFVVIVVAYVFVFIFFRRMFEARGRNSEIVLSRIPMIR